MLSGSQEHDPGAPRHAGGRHTGQSLVDTTVVVLRPFVYNAHGTQM